MARLRVSAALGLNPFLLYPLVAAHGAAAAVLAASLAVFPADPHFGRIARLMKP